MRALEEILIKCTVMCTKETELEQIHGRKKSAQESFVRVINAFGHRTRQECNGTWDTNKERQRTRCCWINRHRNAVPNIVLAKRITRYRNIIHLKYRSVNRTARAGFDKFSRFLLLTYRGCCCFFYCCFYITWNCLDVKWFYLRQNMRIQHPKLNPTRVTKSVEGICYAAVHLKIYACTKSLMHMK